MENTGGGNSSYLLPPPHREGGEVVARYENAEPNDPKTVSVCNPYQPSEVMDAREQRSHIAIIQMAPPAHSSSKATISSSTLQTASTKGSKHGATPKRSKGGVIRGEGTSTKKKRHHCSVQGCGYNTPHTKDLARHMRKHTGEKPFSCDRNGCNKTFTRYDKLVMHIRIHEGHRPFSCQLCNYAATDSSSLRKHLRTHSNERPYKCHLCAYASKDSSQLIVHLRHHTGDSPYVCAYKGCDASFKTPSDLSRHTRLHTGDKPYKCTHCDYRAAVKSNLNVHMRRHTNPKGGGKPDTVSLDDQYNEELEEYPDNVLQSPIPPKSNSDSLPFQYACKECDYKADTIELFCIHMEKSHPGSETRTKNLTGNSRMGKGRPPKKVKDFAEDERNYQCSYCNAAFKCENSLRCHMRQHGTVPNKPADVNPEMYTHVSHNTNIVHASNVDYNVGVAVASSEETIHVEDKNYKLHEMERMQIVQSVITENPSVISSNTNGSTNGATFIQQHYDPTTGHLYVVSYVNQTRADDQHQIDHYSRMCQPK